jgi:FAD-linked sulfhydryl oxidase
MDWGPAAWKFLHTLTFKYSDKPTFQEQKDAEHLFASLKSLLPCEKCRNHYDLEITAQPPDTRSKYHLSSWLVDIHNRVNVRLGKTRVSYADAIKMYDSTQCKGDCQKPRNEVAQTKSLKFLYLILFLGIIAFAACKYMKKI